jgi:hypothetical protein
LLSCERFDYTIQTAGSFVAHNPTGFVLWHCDDASTDPRLRPTVQSFGFRPLVYTRQRVGVTAMIRALSLRLQELGAEWMLLLENDWETVKPFPWSVFDEVSVDVWCLRLYGRYKARGEKRPVRNYHQGRSKADPGWQSHGEYEVGDIHWGNPPSVARVDRVVWLHEGVRTEKQAIERSGLITDRVARVVDNVVYHIGETHTPDFVP